MVEVKDRPKERTQARNSMAHIIHKIRIVGAGQVGNSIATCLRTLRAIMFFQRRCMR